MSHLPERRRIRLPPDAYRRPGAFFITICTSGRSPIFGDCIGGTMRRSALGEICRFHLLDLPVHVPQLCVDEWIIMPDHLHCVLFIERDLPTGLPQAVAGFKSAVSRSVRTSSPTASHPLWQRGFHDRVLRTSEALFRARHYIRANP